ncbi:T9SS type B sorting domain-containing protein [Flavobacteriaceae bacterium R38]|nr:T9SS type B sorting domain-containing protein [Flavobacteriaceae bacterium R38]
MGKFLQFIFLFGSICVFGASEPNTKLKVTDTISVTSNPAKKIEIKAPSDREFECTECTTYIPCIDFEYVTNPDKIELAGKNVYLSAGHPGGNEQLRIFNSASPGSETDLGTPNTIFGGPGQGNGGNATSEGANAIPRNNILIIQDPSSSTPKDLDTRESFITFDLSEFNGVTIDEIDLIDIDEDQTNARIELYTSDNSLIASVPVTAGGNNGISSVSLSSYNNVFSVKVVLDGSGGVVSICFGDQGINFGTPEVTLAHHVHDTFKVDYTDKVVTGECGIIKIIRTWYAYDPCGDIDSDEQVISFWDTKPPVFVEELPQDVKVWCNEIPDAPILTATDNCDTDVKVVFEETRTEDPTCNTNFTITRTWTATDCSGNEAKHVQTIMVKDKDAPVFVEELPQDAEVSCNEVPDPVILTATDNCDPNVTVLFEETQTEDPTCNTNITITRTWTATDCTGNEAKHVQTITVRDTEAPVFVEELPQDAEVSCNEVPDPVVLTATDNCDPNVTVMFEETSTEDPTCNTNITITRTWTATDCTGNEAKHVQTITVRDTEAPVFVEELPQDVEVSCNEVPDPVILTATDNCDPNVTVVFGETSTEDPTCNTNITITRTWTATDCTGNEAKHVQTITVRDTEAPVFVENLPQDVEVSCNEVPDPIILTATDNCDPNVIVVFEETSTEDPTCNTNITITRTWTATDCTGNEAKHVQTITVRDTEAPVFVEDLPQDVEVSCNEVPNPVVLTATDNCDPNITVIFEETTEQTDNSCPFNLTITRTWTATDCTGNEAKHVQTITVRDTEAPVFVEELPQDATFTCTEIPDAPVLTATDNCATDVTVTFEETREDIAGANDFLLIRTWTATDTCGNENVHTQIISAIVEATNAPVDIQICIEDDPIDLLDFLPDGIPDDGAFEVTSGNVTLDGSRFDPFSLALGQFVITYTTTPDQGCPSVIEFQIVVNDDCIVLPCSDRDDIQISKVITPNGDAFNEFFEVNGLNNCVFIADVIIFNRWGNKVFEADDYQNNWRGTSRSGSGFVPAGTYYYVVTLRNSGLDPITGFIYVGTNSR